MSIFNNKIKFLFRMITGFVSISVVFYLNFNSNNNLVTSSTHKQYNTETVEFTAQKAGYYDFLIYRSDKNHIARDVAFTYVKSKTY